MHGDGDVWRCELAIPTCVDCGDWQMEQVTLQDKANNLATFRMENPLVRATKINITGVAGLNDDLNVESIPGFCGTCHDSPNVGNHSVKAPLNIGVPDAGDKKPPVLDIAGLPVFTLTCMQGPLAGRVYKVTYPGRAMISGKCKDIGRFKGPILRGLAAGDEVVVEGGFKLKALAVQLASHET